jgi:hypothetical protein
MRQVIACAQKQRQRWFKVWRGSLYAPLGPVPAQCEVLTRGKERLKTERERELSREPRGGDGGNWGGHALARHTRGGVAGGAAGAGQGWPSSGSQPPAAKDQLLRAQPRAHDWCRRAQLQTRVSQQAIRPCAVPGAGAPLRAAVTCPHKAAAAALRRRGCCICSRRDSAWR